jgi:hypothetical protein
MILYLLLCLVSVLAGCGILTLIGLDVDRRNSLFLAPVLSLSAVAIFMGGLVAGGFSVGEITPAAYILCFGAAVLGAIRHGKTVLASWRALLIIAVLPVLILLPSIVEGFENYSGGLCMDGWSYVTFAQSLQRHALGADGWLPVDVQYAAYFGKATRFISCAFLAFLAPLSGEHNSAQEVLGRYLGWLFFVYGSACLFFAKAVRLNRSMAWVLVFLATLSGWMLKIINANSVDNALALCLLPAALGVLFLMPAPSMQHGIVIGVMLATVLYAYPESSPFTIVAILAMAAQRMIEVRHQLHEFGRMGIALLVTVGGCIFPFASGIASFFHWEATLAGGAVGSRPGEPFYHSLSAPGYILPGYWGLTPDFDGPLIAETYLSHYNLYAVVVASILTLAALFGVSLLLRRREWSLPLFTASMTTAYVVALVHFRYPYAAYKVLLLTWPFIVYEVIVAAEWVWEDLSKRPSGWSHRAVAAVWVGLIMAIVGSFLLQERIFYDSLPFKSVREFRKVSAVENLARGSAVAMVVNETYANIWGVYFLRDTKLYLAGQYRGYMVDTVPFLERSEPVDPSEIHFVVTDNERSFESERLFSRAGPYYIWDCRHGPWALLTKINNPNGVEGGSDPFVWMGKGDTEFQVLSDAATSAVISAQFTLGPSLPGKTRQRMLVKVDGFEQERVVENGEQSFTVPLQPGLNHVIFRSLEKATTFLPKDPRSLLIHIARVSISTAPPVGTAQIREIDTQNKLESWNGTEPFFWMGGGYTTVTVSASAAGVAQLTATLVPGPSLIDKSKARLLITSPFGAKTQQDLNWGPARIDVPVQAGLNRIVMRAIGPNGPNVTAPRDPRIMMIGLLNLRASYRALQDSEDSCGRRH